MNVKNYILSIVASAIICAVARSMLNEKTSIGKIVKLISNLLMTVTILAPLVNISFRNITNYLDDITLQANQHAESGSQMAEDSVAGIIKSKSEAYILDKANSMGLEIGVEVELDDSSNTLPSGVIITGTLSPYTRQVLGAYMEDMLGIPKENQQWKSNS